VAFVVERRLMKVIRRRDREEVPVRRRPSNRERQGVELALAPEQVDDQASRQQAADDPQHGGEPARDIR
jgi:hypothetical protein